MKSKNIILLSILIAIMLGIIAAATSYLYSTPKVQGKAPVATTQADIKDVEPEEEPAAEPAEAEPAPDQVEAQAEAKAKAEAEAKAKAEAEAKAKAEAQAKAQAEAKAKAEAEAKAKAADQSEFKVKNSGTGKMNTLKQLKDNSLVLIDHNGKQLWKIAFPGKIVGEPAQIDIYGNMKIQYLIAEGSKLHLIDRLGREVKKFPLALPGSAKSGPKDVKSGKIVYWEIETSEGTVWFDKKSVTILNQKP